MGGADPGWDGPVELLSSTGSDPGGRAPITGRAAGLARRHPWWTAGVVVVLVVSMASIGYLRSRVPPEVTTVDLSVQVLGDPGANLYVVTARTEGEEIQPLGLIGPGLSRPTSTVGQISATSPGTGYLGATIDCTGDDWWSARGTDYRIRVARTDAYGRIRTFDVPADTAIGESWRKRVQRDCLDLAVFGLPAATAVATVVPDRPGVDLAVRVTNTNTFPLTLRILGNEGAFVSWPAAGVAIGPGRTETVSLHVTVDCEHGRPQLTPHTYSTIAGEYNGPGLEVVAATSPDGVVGSHYSSVTYSGVGSLVRLDPRSAQQIDEALATACPDRP